MYDYFYGAEAEQFFFYRIPKVLFTEERFRSVSAEAKVLYGLLLDRMSLSCKNGWLDTLLNMMGLIISPDFGRILINGEDVTNLPDTALCHFRNSYFGYVVQDFALIERESVFNNIRIPLLYNKKIKRGEHKERIHRAAESLLIQDKLHRKVEQLSGGERQRVAIARAIVCDQPIILADEPTGSLDAVNRDRVMDILMDLCNEKGKTLIIVTHDTSVAERCDRIIRMKDGQITDRAGE